MAAGGYLRGFLQQQVRAELRSMNTQPLSVLLVSATDEYTRTLLTEGWSVLKSEQFSNLSEFIQVRD
jgi:hypothetical protein